MSLKDLFKNKTEEVVINKSLESISAEVESDQYIEEIIQDKYRYLPSVDFSNPANFARYGSAEKYYVDGIKNVYQHYPYDGSKKEKLEWRNNSSQVDLYIFDNIYPKTTGYLNLSSSDLTSAGEFRYSTAPIYVKVKGGPNKAIDGKFENANIYDLNTNRESNLAITSLGNTLEFWFKDELDNTNINYNSSYAFFDLWNGVTASAPNYTRLTLLKVSGSNKFEVTYRSGSYGITKELIDYTFNPSEWHHYAVSFANVNASDIEVSLYVDGNLVKQQTHSATGPINLANNIDSVAHIGSLRAHPVTSNPAYSGYGSAFISIDEFRFWKEKRTSQQIYRNWFTQVGGGTNKDDYNTSLGVYFKFNEGIVDTSTDNSLDHVCLDYSGRVSNGNIENYAIGCKLTGSAIDDYFGETKEFKDPIIFSINPLVQNAITEYGDIGFQYDQTNNSNIYQSLPSWITEESDKLQLNDLPNLVQILASYFDTLHIQIENISKIKNLDYYSESDKPKPFANTILSSHDFDSLELFTDSTLLEKVFSRNEGSEFEANINDIKNTIYQNIYNNLIYIYKSKGTEKSLRNLIRCFGIDDELIKINLYSNNTVYDISDKYTYSSIAKKFVDFNNPDRFEGYIFQKRKATDTANTLSYIPADSAGKLDYAPITLQAEIIFPKQLEIESDNYFLSNFETSSLFGIHTADENQDFYGWNSDEFNFQVYSVRTRIGSPDGYFFLTGSFTGQAINLTSSVYKDLYSNEKWNLAVRIKPSKYDHANFSSGSNITDYTVEFVGYNSIADQADNIFSLSQQVSQSNMVTALRKNKRVYVGSHYNNFDEAYLLEKCDVKISSVRFWYDYLTDEEIKAHSYESDTFGRQQPNWHSDYFLSLTGSRSFTRADTLLLHWNFSAVTGSDALGEFTVEDVSSGSYLDAQEYGLSWFGGYSKYQYPGYAYEFLPNDDQVVNKEFSLSAKKQGFESLNGNDLVQTPDVDDIARTKDSRLVSYFLSIEKSMSQVINDEILKWFATIKNFNNLIGNPAERYNKEYNGMRQMREIFFKNVNNRLDFEKFFEFYKWIDSSISTVIGQLIPASANASTEVRNIVESHILERSKYENKLPTVEFKGEPKSYPISSHLNYSYKEQAAYPNNLNNEERVSRYYNFKPLWLKQRVQRSDTVVETPLFPENDVDREILRQVINQRNTDKLPTLFSDGNAYEGRKDSTRIFTKTYKFSTDNLYVLEDTINPINISNNLFDSRFIFAAEIAASSSEQQIVQPIKKKNNYIRPYEYLFASGRTANNKSFVDLEGNIVQQIGTNNLGFSDRELPSRRPYKNIIVERFSAPGGPEVSSRGALDSAAEEYSPYNSLNSRNSRVRKNYNRWLAESSSIDSENPSLHKVNNNPTYIPIDYTSSLTEPYYDNEFVTHAIPRSDTQYSWIRASVSGTNIPSAYNSEYPNLSSNYSIISGNISGAYVVDYSKLNLVSPKNLNLSTNTISSSDNINDLNKYLSNLNGPYQHPSWKQIRNYENSISINSRNNNNIIIQDVPKDRTIQVTTRTGTTTITVPSSDSDTFTSYKESPVTFNRPINQKVAIADSENVIEVISSYDNNKERFNNPDLVNRTNAGKKDSTEIYDVLSRLDKDAIYDPKPDVIEVSYATQIYPAKENTGLKEVRTKPSYDDFGSTASVVDIRSYWSDNYNIRKRAVETIDLFNYTTTSYAALTDFTGSIMGKYPVLHKISGNIKPSIFALDNLTGSSTEYTATLANARTTGTAINANLNVTMSYGNTSKGILAPYNLAEHRSNILDPDYNLEDLSYLALWNSNSQSWSSGVDIYNNPIPRLNGEIYALYYDTNTNYLYAGGLFTQDEYGNALNYIAYFNGYNWNSLNGGVGGGSNPIVANIISGSDGIYFCGIFNTSSVGTTLNNIAKWNGTILSSLSTGINAAGYALLSSSNGLYVGGGFTIAGGTLVNKIAKWNGSWSALGTGTGLGIGTGAGVLAISEFTGSYIAVGGIFTAVSGTSITSKGIAFYNTSSNTWESATDSGLKINNILGGQVYNIIKCNNDLIMCGNFNETNNSTKKLNKFARYKEDGSWSYVLDKNIIFDIDQEFSNNIYPNTLFYDQINNIIYTGLRTTSSILRKEYNTFGFDLNNQKLVGLKLGLNFTSNKIISNPQQNNTFYFAGGFTKQNTRTYLQTLNYNNTFEGYQYNTIRLLPRPTLIFNNHINSSTGAFDLVNNIGGNIINDINKTTLQKTITYNIDYPEALYFINDGYVYDINLTAGTASIENTSYNKKPFFNSYNEFIDDIKPNTKQYSIIPEYRISDLAEYYIKQQNGNFNTILTSSYLSIDGLAIDNNFSDINSTINKTTQLSNFLLEDNPDLSNKKLTLNLSGIKKLLPYNGFYPSERVKELSSKFINSFLDLKQTFTSVKNDIEVSVDCNTTNLFLNLKNGTPIDQQILTLLQPMFAPGVLLNTIKSSIAVDWPAFITSSVAFSSSELPNFYSYSGSVATNHTATLFIDKEPNYRFPFESLIDLETSIPTELLSTSSNLYYLDPTYYSTDVVSGSDRQYLRYPSYNMSESGSLKTFKFNNPDYKLAMHNFLAEVPSFFLKNGLSKFVSAPENKFLTAISGVTYYMDVILEKDAGYKEYVMDPYYESAKTNPESHTSGSILPLSPDSLYGPPVRYWNNINASELTSSGWYNLFIKEIDTPAYAPYVPPYYYGKAIARLSFTAEDDIQYSLSDIQSKLNIEYINSGAAELFAERSNFISSSFNKPYTDNYSSSPAYKQMMTLSSSINFDLRTENNDPVFDAANSRLSAVGKPTVINNSWVIQTKFETPSINFANVDKTTNIGLNFLGGNKNTTFQFVEGVYSNLFKGLWTTYGDPVETEGIKLSIKDPYPFLNPTLTRQFKTGSLMQLCGFRRGEERTIGSIAETKEISEGVVIIPYTVNGKNHGTAIKEDYAITLPEIIGENGVYNKRLRGSGPYYFAISRQKLNEVIGLSFDANSLVTFDEIKRRVNSSDVDQDNSIVKLVKAMTKYSIPPHLDWIRNKNITPFVMYVGEFTSTLDKRDLADIWQGIMPKPSYRAEKEEISISHDMTALELFHGKKLPKDLKFKVFKVKEKANINYYKLTEDSRDDSRFKFEFGNSNTQTIPEYSYNWPYDYFSLVELVNIEAEIKVKK